MTTTSRSVGRQQFLDDLLIDALEGGVTSQWATATSVDRDGALNIRRAILRDEDSPAFDEPRDWEVTLETLERGFEALRKQPSLLGETQATALLIVDDTNGLGGSYDAIGADAILQLGLFGTVVFS